MPPQTRRKAVSQPGPTLRALRVCKTSRASARPLMRLRVLPNRAAAVMQPKASGRGTPRKISTACGASNKERAGRDNQGQGAEAKKTEAALTRIVFLC
jgi:hypothetical protein